MNDLPPGFSAPSWSTNGLLVIVAVGRSLAILSSTVGSEPLGKFLLYLIFQPLPSTQIPVIMIRFEAF